MGRNDRHGVDLRRLRVFVEVCDRGSISGAASAIGLAQPAVTRQIKLLEEEVGIGLLHRTGRGTTPTASGRYLFDHVRSHLAALDAIVDGLRGQLRRVPGTVTLGICPTIAPLFLADLQGYMRASHPIVDLVVIEAYSGDLQSLMECGRIDLALTYRPVESEGLQCHDLLQEQLVLVRRKAMNGASPSLSLAEIGSLDLILPSRIHQLRQVIDRLCERRGIRLTPALELDSLDAAKAALDDPGVHLATILPIHSIAVDVGNGRFTVHRIDDPEMVRTIALVYPEPTEGKSPPDFLLEHIRMLALRLKAGPGMVF